MSLTRAEIQKIAKLSRISITGEEESKLIDQLSAVVDFFKQLQTADTSGVNVSGLEDEGANRMRADEPTESGVQEAILSQVPLREENFIKVKSVL